MGFNSCGGPAGRTLGDAIYAETILSSSILSEVLLGLNILAKFFTLSISSYFRENGDSSFTLLITDTKFVSASSALSMDDT